MPYPYGMQNSPVVGNGLGGLPRRTTPVASTATVVQRRYDLQQIATSPTSFPTYSTNSRSIAIMLGGKIYKYYKTDFTPEIYRWSANYSAAGYSNVEDLNTGVTGSITRLPTPSVSDNLRFNYCWSIEYSSTSGTFCYSGLPPFKVTVSGSDTTYTNVAAPATGTYDGGGTWTSMTFFHNTAIISKTGEMLMIGQDNANNLALLRFNPQTLAFIGATKPATAFFTTSVSYASARILTTSYGYSVGVAWTASSTSGYVWLVNFTNDFTVFSHGRSTVTTSGETTICYGVTVGSEGCMAVFGTDTGYKGGIGTCYASTSGTVTTQNLTFLNGFGSNTGLSDQAKLLRYVFGSRNGTEAGGRNHGTNIDGTLMCPLLSANQSYYSVIFYQAGSYAAYYHINTTPVLENEVPYNGYPSHETLCAKNFSMANTYTHGVVGDTNGFIHIPNTYASEGNQLFKKVYR